VLEADFLTRWGVAEYLREIGFMTVEAVDVEEAKAILSAGVVVDVVFCNVDSDVSRDRNEFPQWIGQQFPGMPMLLTSMDVTAAELARNAPMRRFVAKPHTFGDIDSHLVELTGTSHKAD
jgi:DNA-binding NtrC family response regulator